VLIAPTPLTIRKSYDLTERQAQALVDLEAYCADLGLLVSICCRVCRSVGNPSQCDGASHSHSDGTLTFSVTCECTTRAFRGTLTAPPLPRPLRKPRLDLAVRPEQILTRQQMRVFQDAADALHQLRLYYELRCLACREEDRLTDGCWGASETNANQFVIECACTRRIYKGADVKVEA
jgi:hypothetical protein